MKYKFKSSGIYDLREMLRLTAMLNSRREEILFNYIRDAKLARSRVVEMKETSLGVWQAK